MIQYVCDNCGNTVVEAEAVGLGVKREDKGVVNYTHPVNNIVLTLTLSRENSDNQFCKACMWLVIDHFITNLGPEYVDGPESESEIGPVYSSPESNTIVSGMPAPSVLSFPRTDISPEDGDRGVIRSVGGSTWPDRGSKESTVHRTGWAASTKGAKRRWFRFNKGRLL